MSNKHKVQIGDFYNLGFCVAQLVVQESMSNSDNPLYSKYDYRDTIKTWIKAINKKILSLGLDFQISPKQITTELFNTIKLNFSEPLLIQKEIAFDLGIDVFYWEEICIVELERSNGRRRNLELEIRNSLGLLNITDSKIYALLELHTKEGSTEEFVKLLMSNVQTFNRIIETQLNVKYSCTATDIENIKNYDVALSFAGEDRVYVEKVANILKNNSVRVFYDDYEKVALWGKDLYTYLHSLYFERAQYCVVFISEFYKKSLWTKHELRSIFERELQSDSEYLLPARFDDTILPGLPSTIGWIDLRKYSESEFAQLIIEKVL